MKPRTIILATVIVILLVCAWDTPAANRTTFFERVYEHIRNDRNQSFVVPSHGRKRAEFLRAQLERLRGNVADIDAAINRGVRAEAIEGHLVDTGAITLVMWEIVKRGEQ
jgi:hypothetical protein